MKFASRALYAVPRIRIQSEVYFGLKGKILGNNNNQLFSLLPLLPHSVLWKRTIMTEINTFVKSKK